MPWVVFLSDPLVLEGLLGIEVFELMDVASAEPLALNLSFRFPRRSIYTTIMELGRRRPSPLWFWEPNSIVVVYMDPLGFEARADPKACNPLMLRCHA